MSTPARLLVLDTVMVDVVVRVPRLPDLGGDVRALEHRVVTGGGLNVAVAARRHGLEVAFVGRLGEGPMAEVARRALVDEQIEHLQARRPDAGDLGFCLVIVDDAGERTFVTSTGAELSLGRDDLDGAGAREGDLVFLSGYDLVYPEIVETVTDWVTGLAAGVVVAFDPGPRVADIPTEALEAVLARSDWLLCNEVEARWLGAGREDPAALADRVGGGGLVVHRGPDGAVVVTVGAAPREVPAFPCEVLDTNGAGDTHDGVFLAEWVRGGDPWEAARWANAAAAMAIGRLGPATCPSREEVLAWLGDHAGRE